MRNWKAIMPIALSLVIAASGTYFLYQWIQKQTATQEVVMVDTEAIPVAVASVDLPWGTKITEEMVKMSPYLKESLPAGHFRNINELKDRVLIESMKKGDPIVNHRLAPEDIKTGGVSAVLKTGKRALAVKGDKVIGISGFINPGNRVDVLVTMREPDKKIDRTKMILQDIPVLATGTQIQQNEKGEPAPVDVYTLEVTPKQAEKLALAAAEGKLQFALRNVVDKEDVNTPGTTISQTLAGYTGEVTPPKVQGRKSHKPVRKWKPRRTVTVEVIKGTDVSKKKYKL
jgi:pilus assembly protein CpaB